jgi:hypothetical protein
MINLPDLKLWLNLQGVSTHMSFGEQPEDPTNNYTFIETGRMRLTLERAFDVPTFQVLTRASDGETARNMAAALDDLILDTDRGFYLGDKWVIDMGNLSGPVSLGKDERNRPEFSANYWIELSRV